MNFKYVIIFFTILTFDSLFAQEVNVCEKTFLGKMREINGPFGPEKCDELWVAGDSAGGNLTLMLTAWACDHGLRPVDGAITFSPSVDDTLAGKSLYQNAKTDVQLGVFGKPLKYARYPLMLMMWKHYGILPSSPKVPPLRGDLSRLPSTPMFASNSEVLLDPIVRYANKANAAGSPVELLLWDHMTHVWPAFVPVMEEANEAMNYVVEFVKKQRLKKAK